MKLNYKLGAAAIVAVAGVAMVIPNTTEALDGTGHIGFTFMSAEPTVPEPTRSSGSTGPIITSNPTLPVTNPGEFGIVTVTPLEFGTHSVVSASTVRDYKAQGYSANEGAYTTANFVQFQDYRAATNHSYSLKAQITSTFKSGTEFFKGAELEYSKAWVRTQDFGLDDSLQPAGVSTTTTLTAAQTIDTAGASATFINNANTTGLGFGAYALVFGGQGGAAVDDAINLNIPTTNNILVGDYNAVITWTLSETL